VCAPNANSSSSRADEHSQVQWPSTTHQTRNYILVYICNGKWQSTSAVLIRVCRDYGPAKWLAGWFWMSISLTNSLPRKRGRGRCRRKQGAVKCTVTGELSGTQTYILAPRRQAVYLCVCRQVQGSVQLVRQ
jgi:hypothetical protein